VTSDLQLCIQDQKATLEASHDETITGLASVPVGPPQLHRAALEEEGHVFKTPAQVLRKCKNGGESQHTRTRVELRETVAHTTCS